MSTQTQTPSVSQINRKTADQYRALSQQCRDERARSWEDSDSDGFLSQWANDQMDSRYRHLADVADNGWMIDRVALFDLQGQIVPAVQREGEYGSYWAIINPEAPRGKYLGFFTESKAQNAATARKNNAKKGYYVGWVRVPCEEDGRTGRTRDLIEPWQHGAQVTDNGQ